MNFRLLLSEKPPNKGETVGSLQQLRPPAHSLRRSRWLYSRRPTVRNLSSPPAASEQASQ